MSLFDFNHRQPQGFIGVLDALQRLEEDPEQLSLERAQRYEDPPPPYPSSGETTQPASPTEAPVSDEETRQARRLAMLRSYPYYQFSSQARREKERLILQMADGRYGRRQTLSYDSSADLRANCENNVRARWVEQGIWKDNWGPAWPKGAHPSDGPWSSSHWGIEHPAPCGRWLHEKRPDPKMPSPEPAPKPFAGSFRKEPNTAAEEPGRAPARDVTEAPAATSEHDTSASRPYQQFIFQLSKEREWIRDELLFNRSTGRIDIDAMAYESVKKNWIEDEIWNPTWGELPGATWMHEDLADEEERQKSNTEANAVGDDEQPPRLPSPGPFDSEPMPGVNTEGTSNNNIFPIPEEVDVPSVEITRARGKRKRTKSTSRLATVKASPRSAEEPTGRVLRGVRASKVTKPSESPSTAPNTRLRKRNSRLPGSGTSKTKSKVEHQRQPNARTKNATLQSPSDWVVKNNTRQRRGPKVDDQPVATIAPRRSKRIAAQMRERKTAEKSNEPKGRPRSRLTAASTPTDSNPVRKRQGGGGPKGGTRAKRKSRS